MGWVLRGITDGRGACDHCGRSLSRLFLVTGPDGAELAVGRVCAAKMTGYSWTVAQAERAARSAAADAQAARVYGDLWDEARAAVARSAARTGHAGSAGDALTAMRNGLGWTGEHDEVRAWVRNVLDSLSN